MNSSKSIQPHHFADTTLVTISICGCAACRAIERFICSLKMVDANGKESASVSEISDAGIAEFLRTLSNIADGNLTYSDTNVSGYGPKHAIAETRRANAKRRQRG